MAIATSKTVLVDPLPPPKKVARHRIVLELSINEAETIRAVLNRVGGPAETTRRKYVNQVLDALYGEGVGLPHAKFQLNHPDRIYFDQETDNPEKD